MSPAPIIPTSKHSYNPECSCPACAAAFLERLRNRRVHEYGADDPLGPAKGIINACICMIVIITCLVGAVLIWTQTADARPTKQPEPIAAPQSLLKARQACPNDASILECRAALRRAYDAVGWQRHARWQASAGKTSDVVRDAIQWASSQTGVPAWRLTNIAACESHLFFLAHNGQFLGVWQLGATHRSDPIFRVVPWMDPYAQAIHVARFIKRHGESQWQCSSSGGLRW